MVVPGVEPGTARFLMANSPPQNLAPLLLRPLRLLVPAERLRKTRIVLLKILHWPLVACIIGFERGRQLVHDRGRSAKSSFAATGENSSHATAILRRPPLSSNKSGISRPGSYQSPLAAGQARAARKTPTHGTAAANNETVEALEMLAKNLESQLDAVHSLIAREKASTSAAATR